MHNRRCSLENGNLNIGSDDTVGGVAVAREEGLVADDTSKKSQRGEEHRSVETPS